MVFRHLRIACFLSLSVIACSSSDDHPTPLDQGQSGSGGGDAGVDSSDASEADAPQADAFQDTSPDTGKDAAQDAGEDAGSNAWIPATTGSLVVMFDLDAAGQGVKRLDDVVVSQNLTSLTLAGQPHIGVAFLAHDWSSSGFTLFDVVSVAEDGSDFAVTYLYCSGSELAYAYTESFLHPMDWETTTGSCDFLMESRLTEVSLPALEAVPAAIDSGVTIEGVSINLGPTGGSLELEGQMWELIPFDTVDCTDCPDGPWYEVHAMLRRTDEGCFVILYLFPDDPGSVMLANGVCLPSLEQPYQMYDATWSGAVPPQMLPMWRPLW